MVEKKSNRPKKPKKPKKVLTEDEIFLAQFYDEKGKFSHNNFAEYIKETYHGILINNVTHIYKDGIYTANQDEIKRVMVFLIPDLKDAQCKEVLTRLRLACFEHEIDRDYICLENGLYNITTNELINHSPYYIVVNKIPLKYNPNVKSKVIDKALDQWACNDKEVRLLLEEMVGYLFLPRNELGKAFILLGDGSTGKSTFLKMCKALLGKKNYSALSLQDLNKQFRLVRLHNKMANFGDDIPKKFISDSSILKKVVTGEDVEAEYKGKDVFTLESTAKLIFSANDMVRIDDNTDGLFRRLVYVPFNNKFAKGKGNYELYAIDEITEESSLQYLFILAMQGLKRLTENGEFTMPEVVKKAQIEFKRYNNHVYEFLDHVGDIDEKSTTEIYVEYDWWVTKIGYEKEKLTQTALTRAIKQIKNLETQPKRDGDNVIRMFKKKGI